MKCFWMIFHLKLDARQVAHGFRALLLCSPRRMAKLMLPSSLLDLQLLVHKGWPDDTWGGFTSQLLLKPVPIGVLASEVVL